MRILPRPVVPTWFSALVSISVALIVVTLLSYALNDGGPLPRLLFWVGLGGENNVGAWWSGMLLALSALLAFDGFADSNRPSRERKGWCALGFAMLLLSFDEVASLHEFLSRYEYEYVYLALLGAVGLGLVGYALTQLRRAGVRTGTLRLLIVGFGLLATVPVHEAVQKSFEWTNPVVYGIRAALEEGTEIAAMLLFVWVLRENSMSLLRGSRDLFAVPAHRRRLIRASAIVLWPALTAATFVMPQPGGPADWLASVLFLLCALLARRAMVLGGAQAASARLVLFYAAASALATAVAVDWNPVVFDTRVSLRGVVLALLVVGAALFLPAHGRRLHVPRALLMSATIAAGAFVWSDSQLLWCGLPPVLAIWFYLIESKAVTVRSMPTATFAPTTA